MSTRCNVKIGNTWLYRHHDGMIETTGLDLIRTILAIPNCNADNLIGGLLSKFYDIASYEDAPRAVYQLTDDKHGDIEYLYDVDLENRVIRVRNYWLDDKGEQYRKYSYIYLDSQDTQDIINSDNLKMKIWENLKRNKIQLLNNISIDVNIRHKVVNIKMYTAKIHRIKELQEIDSKLRCLVDVIKSIVGTGYSVTKYHHEYR